jgi:methionyl-tRNA formyltransferase
MKIVYLGSGEFGIESLNTLAASRHSLELIVTQPPHLAGRGRKSRPTPVARWAREHSITLIEPENVNTSEVVEEISSFNADVIAVAAFGQKIGNEIIAMPPKGIINAHASLVPAYRGAAPVNWAIINGGKETGVSIITVVEKIDAGDVLAETKTEIGADETAGQLHARLGMLAGPLLLKAIDAINAGTATYTQQDSSQVTMARKLKKSDGYLDFSDSAESLRNRIRGLWPWPGASAVYTSHKTGKSQQVTIAMAQVIECDNVAGLEAGTMNESLDIVCGSNALRITSIKPAGGSIMDFKSFVNGRQCSSGDVFTQMG